MKKIYEKNFAVLLDTHSRVIWACGNKEWMNEYMPHPLLKELPEFCMWSIYQ